MNISVIGVRIDQILNGDLGNVNVSQDTPYMDHNVFLIKMMAMTVKLIVQLVLSLIPNRKNVWHVHKDASAAQIHTLAEIVILISLLTLFLNFVLNAAEMEEDIH